MTLPADIGAGSIDRGLSGTKKAAVKNEVSANCGAAKFDAAVHMNIAEDHAASDPHLQSIECTPVNIFRIEQIEIKR